MKIGLVDLCTSHPHKFVPLLQKLGCEVAAVWDSGDAREPGFAAEFAEQFDIPHVCRDLAEMVELVDAVTIHSADWGRHIERAEPFLAADKFVCIDKPMVGSVADVERLLDLDRRCPGRIFGGSSCAVTEPLLHLRDEATAVGPIIAALVSGPNDLFSYGIHSVELAQAILGYDAESVTCLRPEPLGNYLVRFSSGRDLHLHMHTPSHAWFICVQTTEGGPMTAVLDPARLYQDFLQRFIDFTEGRPGDWLLSERLQPIYTAIAMDRARSRPGEEVRLDTLQPEDGFDGAAFTRAYREARDRGANLYLEQKLQRWSKGLAEAATR